MILTLTLNKDFNAKNSRTAVVEVTRPLNHANQYIGKVTFLMPENGDNEIQHQFGYGESLHFTTQAHIINAAAAMLETHYDQQSCYTLSKATIEV